MEKIYFLTRAYNSEKTLARCIDSVLNQTKYGENIEYWVCDNGSTDKTREILAKYAENDPRIKAFYNEENNIWNSQSRVFWDLPVLMKEDDLLCMLDSDDEYKHDFLKKIIPFIRENNLDIAMGGSDFIDETNGNIVGQRVLEQSLVLDSPDKFTNYFPLYHQFTRTLWGKVYTGKIANKMATPNNHSDEFWNDFSSSGDTYMVYSTLKHCTRVGIFPEIIHKYYISKTSSSYRWHYGRFIGNELLNEDAEEYLNKFGPISERNRVFLDRVYANNLSDNLVVLCSSQGMTAEDKFRELRRSVDYRVTSEMMRLDFPDIIQCKKNIFNAALLFGQELKQENEDFKAALRLICPKCAPFVAVNEIELYAREGALQNALFNDNMVELVDQLLRLISKGAYTKQFDLFKIVEKFTADRELLVEITDAKFIKKHSDIFLLIWQKKYFQALDKMTDMLQKKNTADESFLRVYISLSEILKSDDELVLGKVRLAMYYYSQKQPEESRAVLKELEDMGVEDNDDIILIKAKLGNI